MRRTLRIFLSALLGIAFLVSPSILLSQQLEIVFGEDVILFIEDGYLVLALNLSFPFGQTGSWTQPGQPVVFLPPTTLGPPTGAPVPIPGAVNSCSSAAGVVLDQLGRFVFLTDSPRNLVCVHRRDPETGGLTPVPGSPFSTGGNSPERLAVDPSGQFVFVANSGSNNVTVFSLNRDTGALTPVSGSPFNVGSQPLDVTTDGFGRFLYVANNLSNSLSAFSINRSSGMLTTIPGAPFSMGSFLYRVEADPLGRFLYAMDGQSIFVLSIGATGVLTPAAGSPLTLNPPPSAIAADPTGQFLLVTQRTRFIGQNDTVASYRVNTNGSLTAVGAPVSLGEGTSPSAVAVDQGGRWVYVVNQSARSIAGFSFHPITGALTPIAGSPFAAGVSPLDVAVYTRLRIRDIAFLQTFSPKDRRWQGEHPLIAGQSLLGVCQRVWLWVPQPASFPVPQQARARSHSWPELSIVPVNRLQESSRFRSRLETHQGPRRPFRRVHGPKA